VAHATLLEALILCVGCALLQACAGLQEQLAAAQHKNSKLTAAQDKLEIILHDLETASAEEHQQLEHQLAAANKALRSTSQQLTAAQQELAASQQQLKTSAEQLAGVQQQLADTTAELQQLQNAAAGSTAATPVAAGTSAQVGLRHWLQVQGFVMGPPVFRLTRVVLEQQAPCSLCLQPGCRASEAACRRLQPVCVTSWQGRQPGCWHGVHGVHRAGWQGHLASLVPLVLSHFLIPQLC
jgi:hypothetical protein